MHTSTECTNLGEQTVAFGGATPYNPENRRIVEVKVVDACAGRRRSPGQESMARTTSTDTDPCSRAQRSRKHGPDGKRRCSFRCCPRRLCVNSPVARACAANMANALLAMNWGFNDTDGNPCGDQPGGAPPGSPPTCAPHPPSPDSDAQSPAASRSQVRWTVVLDPDYDFERAWRILLYHLLLRTDALAVIVRAPDEAER